jgi:8-oxo-dGTP diphosphatase
LENPAAVGAGGRDKKPQTILTDGAIGWNMGRIRAVGIAVKDGRVALLRRFVKSKGEYYVFPGGGVEKGETPEEAVVREMMEETCLKVEVDRLLCVLKDDLRHEFYFILKDISGKIMLGDGPERAEQSDDDSHEPMWVALNKIEGLVLYPESIKRKVIELFLEKKN